VTRMTGENVSPYVRATLVRLIPQRTAMHTKEESPMAAPHHTSMARRFVAGTSAQTRTRRRSARRQALGALLGGLVLLSLAAPHPGQAEEPFTTASLQGTYAFVSDQENTASVGLITFDGEGGLTLEILINRPDERGGREIDPASGPGTYTVDAAGTGVATLVATVGTRPPERSRFDFVITAVADKGHGDRLATEVFAVARSGGQRGNVIAPTWKRIAD
jgi:hypothetical protein